MAGVTIPGCIYKSILLILSEWEQDGSRLKIRRVAAHLTRHSLKAQITYGYVT